MGMDRLLLFLALITSFLLTTALQCDEHTSCLYFITCYGGATDDVTANSTETAPTVNASYDIGIAEAYKRDCKRFGFVSTLSILFTSTFSMNISFATDLNDVGFALGSPTDVSRLAFRTDSNVTAYLNGWPLVLEQPTKTVDDLGRSTYSFRLANPMGGAIHSFFVGPVSFLQGEQRILTEVPDDFRNAVKRNLACDATPIHDVCLNSPNACEKVRITNHSLSCAHSGQLQVQSDSSWIDIALAICRNEKWELTKDDGEKAKTRDEITIRVSCKRAPTSVTTSPDATTVEPEEDKETDSLESNPEEKGPDPGAMVADKTTVTPPPTPAKKHDHGDRLVLPGSKWAWIGGGIVLLIVIISVNVIVCLYCFRTKASDESTVKLSKTVKRNKKKEGKRHSPVGGDSSHQLSSSELMGDSTKQKSTKSSKPARTMAPRTIEAVKSDFGGQTTEKNLDRIKTERI